MTELRQLEEENRRLKRLLADLSLLQDVIRKKVLRPVLNREAIEYLLAAYRIGVRRGCQLMMQSRTFYNYHSCRARAGWLSTRKPIGFTV